MAMILVFIVIISARPPRRTLPFKTMRYGPRIAPGGSIHNVFADKVSVRALPFGFQKGKRPRIQGSSPTYTQ
eukprot:scaffold37_cov159-Amphora_coffeaeformis.AAC.1